MAYIRKRTRKKTGKSYYTACFKDQAGRWHEESAGPLKRDAEALLMRRVEEVCSGKYGVPIKDDPKFKDYSPRYLSEKSGEIKASTLRDYASVIRNHLDPYFKNTRVSQIRPSRIKDFKKHMGEKDISPATQRKVYNILKAMLRHAFASEIIVQDPTTGTRGPSVERREMGFLTPDQIAKLLETAEGLVLAIIAVACLSGLRPGEIVALRWMDIDFHLNVIRVTRSYDPRNGFTDPKTYYARRTVPILPTLRRILLEYQESVGNPERDSLMFCNKVGGPLDRRNFISRQYNDVFKEAEIKRVMFKELRHTYATLCIAAGVEPKQLQRIMGHSSIQVTLDVYAHILPNYYGEAAAEMGKLITPGDNGSKHECPAEDGGKLKYEGVPGNIAEHG